MFFLKWLPSPATEVTFGVHEHGFYWFLKITNDTDNWSLVLCLGEEPYKNIPSHQVIGRVGCGYRMSQPPQCSNEL